MTSYPTRCQIVDPGGSPLGDTGLSRVAPSISRPHVGKFGTAEEEGNTVKITLDDGTVIYGYECWWRPVE